MGRLAQTLGIKGRNCALLRLSNSRRKTITSATYNISADTLLASSIDDFRREDTWQDFSIEPTMTIAFKITLLSGAYATGNWKGVIEVDSAALLDDVHLAILDALNFDNDHMYEFFTAKTERSRQRVTFDDENGDVHERTLDSLFPLPKGNRLYYLFDYGDDWLFSISKNKSPVRELGRSEALPRLVSESGEKPEQYPSFED